jgi:hypothetical protein
MGAPQLTTWNEKRTYVRSCQATGSASFVGFCKSSVFDVLLVCVHVACFHSCSACIPQFSCIFNSNVIIMH